MAFVNEKFIPKEQQLEIDKIAKRLGRDIVPDRRTVDKELGVTLLCFGVGRYSQYEGESTPGLYVMLWGDEEIVFEAYTRDSDTMLAKNKITAIFAVTPLLISESIKDSHEYLKSLIKAALDCIAQSWYPFAIDTIVEFHPNQSAP